MDYNVYLFTEVHFLFYKTTNCTTWPYKYRNILAACTNNILIALILPNDVMETNKKKNTDKTAQDALFNLK